MKYFIWLEIDKITIIWSEESKIIDSPEFHSHIIPGSSESQFLPSNSIIPSAPESEVLSDQIVASFEENHALANEGRIYDSVKDCPVLSNAMSIKIHFNEVLGNVEINNELNDRFGLDENQTREKMNSKIKYCLSCSLDKIFLFLVTVGAFTVFLQEIYFNFQDEKKVLNFVLILKIFSKKNAKRLFLLFAVEKAAYTKLNLNL